MRAFVIGASGQAHVAIDTIEKHGEYTISGLVDSFKPVGPTALGYDILGRVDELPALVSAHAIDAVFVGIGDNWIRGRISREIEHLVPGLTFLTAVHPSAQVGRRVKLGKGVLVMAGAVVMPNAEIRDGAFVGTRASLDHDSVMEEFSSLAPGAITGGNVRIGAFTAVALGANIIHGICIGQQSVIGAGATVLQDIPPNVVAYGTPAKVIRQRQAGDCYL